MTWYCLEIFGGFDTSYEQKQINLQFLHIMVKPVGDAIELQAGEAVFFYNTFGCWGGLLQRHQSLAMELNQNLATFFSTHPPFRSREGCLSRGSVQQNHHHWTNRNFTLLAQVINKSCVPWPYNVNIITEESFDNVFK